MVAPSLVTGPIEEMPFLIYLRLRVERYNGGAGPALVCINDWPNIFEQDGKTLLIDKTSTWNIFVLETQNEIQQAIFSFQTLQPQGSC